MSRFCYMAVLSILLVSASVAAVALQTGEAAPAFKLLDQFGKTWELSQLNGSVVVLVVADRDSGRAMGPWYDHLKNDYANRTQLLGLLELRGVPGIGRGIARSKIRKETKDPLMVDFNGSTAKAYLVSSKHPVVVVIDKTGVVRAIEQTEYTDKAYKSISSAIDKALK